MKDRLDFYNSYKEEHRIFNNRVQRFWAIFGVLFSIYTLITLDDFWLFLLTLAMMTTIGAWGLNIVSGFAGQISLAHGAFIGIGTYTAFVLGGNIGSSVLSYGLDMAIWLPLSGLVPMLFGILISPVTSKLKGLNLGLFSIGIVYFVLHIFQNFRTVTGGSGLGRKSPDFVFLGFNFENGITVGNLVLNENNLIALFTLMVLILSGFGVKNIARTMRQIQLFLELFFLLEIGILQLRLLVLTYLDIRELLTQFHHFMQVYAEHYFLPSLEELNLINLILSIL